MRLTGYFGGLEEKKIGWKRLKGRFGPGCDGGRAFAKAGGWGVDCRVGDSVLPQGDYRINPGRS
jgi:hypothetical protein